MILIILSFTLTRQPSTLRLTASMKEAMKRSKANDEFDGRGRDVYL